MRTKKSYSAKTVQDWFVWKLNNDEYNSIEDQYVKECKSLGWVHTDVLYSFLGICALGVYVFNKDKFIVKDKVITLKDSRQELYSKNFVASAFNDNPNNLEGIEKLSDILKNFVSIYNSIGNVIPIWPGGNRAKGNSKIGCFDVPELFFYKYKPWFYTLSRVYKATLFLDGKIDKKTLNHKKYEDLTKFLKTINDEEKYKTFINNAIEIIKYREDNLKKIWKIKALRNKSINF